jgi:small subunit ribosomal protein S1
MVKSIDRDLGRINLSYKDCLGTWEENAQKFQEGMTVKGIVRDTEKNKNGIFVELTPNLVGMTEYTKKVEYGQTVDVCIKKIIPEKKKIKLIIV